MGMGQTLRSVLIVLCGVALVTPQVDASPDGLPKEVAGPTRSYSFDEPSEAEAFEAVATGEALRRKSLPKIADGRLVLLESWWKSTNSVGFSAPTAEATRNIAVSWKLTMNTGTEGAGFAWLSVSEFGATGKAPEVEQWEAPSIPGSFAVGFDASNPPNRDPFRGSGNAYDRPQHEVSLHWNGTEIVKRMTPEDFRDEKPHEVVLSITFVPGGADVSLKIDEAAIFDAYFIPSMTPYVGRPAFGARNVDTAGDVLIDDLRIGCIDPIPVPEAPLSIVAIDHKINDAKHTTNEAVVEFPSDTDRFARIICTLRLDEPEAGFDPWDRLAAIYVYDDTGERFELLRYITPYDRGFEWKVDVTDFRPLLRGKRRVEQSCQTYAEGWLVTVTFDFYAGAADRLAYKVVNLWAGNPEVGNPEKPIEAFYVPKTVRVDEQAASVKARIVVTGHGMSPNTNNAAEFMPIERAFTVNGTAFRNRLWKTDNYLNPCRPQGGTWKYDRAGWAPGDVVRPWEVDITGLISKDRELKIEYKLDPYVNEARGETWAPFHHTESQVILYRKP